MVKNLQKNILYILNILYKLQCDKKCKTFRIKYKLCNFFLEYRNVIEI